MIRDKINNKNKKTKLVALAGTTIAITLLIASVAAIGTAPPSVQQQGQGPEQEERTPGPTITSGNIVDDTIVSEDLKDGEAVRSEDIVDGQVSNEDLADDAVTTDKIADGEVTSDDLAPGTIPIGGGTPDDNSVTSATIVDGEVNTADLADGAVTQDKIADNAIQPNIQRVQGSTATATPGSAAIATAECPSGTILTGGGFYMSDTYMRVIRSYPFDMDTWRVIGFNDATQINGGIIAFALCIGPSP